MTQPHVIIRACSHYDPEHIRSIIRDGLDALRLRPQGRVLVKPNVVMAGRMFPHAYTRPEFTEGVVRALQDRGADIEELSIGERCGITVPTRYAFKEAGYNDLAARLDGVRLVPFEEDPQVEIPLYHPQRLRDSIYTPRSVAAADFFVNCPKFKAHPWTTVTFSNKAYIGIQDDPHRLLDHDHKLDEKIADLQYITQPKFIAIDAITAGEGRMLTPIPFDLGLVIMGNNQMAFDSVCCHIIGVDPLSVPHLRLIHERGFGPVDLDAIQISGDVSLTEAKRRAQGFRVGLIRVEDYFAGTNIRAYAGPPPSDTTDYCWGGCPGALEEAIEILRVVDGRSDAKMPRTHLVFGKYTGEVPAAPGEKVVFIGDCAEYDGTIADRPVRIRSQYVDRSAKHPLTAKGEDIFSKMLSTQVRMLAQSGQQVIRLTGCPVSVSEQVLTLVALGNLTNPYLDPELSVPFTHTYLSTRTRQLIQRLRGQGYNQPGPFPRGTSRPPQNLPPPGASLHLEHPRDPPLRR